MPDHEDQSSDGGEARALRRVLVRIADALDCPVSDLFTSEELPLGNLGELIRIWNKISDPAGRARLLVLAQEEASRCTVRDGGG